jgi:sugar transferase (PEP-CTERM/EpsH1 system associated)
VRILVISNTIPYPPVSGGRVRTYNLLKRIARHHEVWLACHLHAPEEVEGVPHMEGICARVATGLLERRSPLAHLPGIARYLTMGWPPELKFLHVPALARTVATWCRETAFDVVQIEESRMALYNEVLPAHRAAARVLTFYDIAFDQSARIARVEGTRGARARARLHSAIMRWWEPRYSERFTRCVVVSDDDRQRLAAANPRLRIDVVSNGVDTAGYHPLGWERSEPALLFIGNMSYRPCIDAAVYLANSILPRIRRRVSATELWIVGDRPAPEVTALAGDGVHITGRVADIIPYYERCTVCMVPLRAGGGTRLKILEAMALGRPVVSTTLGCEGLDVVPGEHLLVADDADGLADAAIALLSDATRRDRVVERARRLVEQRYDWDAIAERMLQVYAEVVAAPVGPVVQAGIGSGQ